MEHTHDHHHEAHDHEHHDHDHHHDHDNRLEWAKALTLLGLGSYFAYNLASGNVVNYINTRFIWLSYVAAGLFALYGGYVLYTLVQAQRGHIVEHEHDHQHDHASWGILAIVTVPILIGFLSTSAPLGADAINGSVSINAIGGENGMVISSDDSSQWHVLDWLRTFEQSDDLSAFEGQTANIVGFIYKEPTYSDNTAMITRFAVNCCVADATAIGLPVRGDVIAQLNQGTWVRIEGTFTLDTFNGQQVPVITPLEIEPAEVPDPPYITP